MSDSKGDSDLAAGDPLGVADLFGDLRKNWGWLLALGVLFMLLGLAGLLVTAALTLVTVTLLGIFLLFGGGLQLAHAFGHRRWRGTWPHVAIGLLYIAGGILILIDPVLASLTLTVVLAAFILAAGLMRLLLAWQHRGEPGTGMLTLSGLLALLLGIVIIAGWPVSGLTVIGIFVAVEMLFHGVAYAGLAMALRRT